MSSFPPPPGVPQALPDGVYQEIGIPTFDANFWQQAVSYLSIGTVAAGGCDPPLVPDGPASGPFWWTLAGGEDYSYFFESAGGEAALDFTTWEAMRITVSTAATVYLPISERGCGGSVGRALTWTISVYIDHEELGMGLARVIQYDASPLYSGAPVTEPVVPEVIFEDPAMFLIQSPTVFPKIICETQGEWAVFGGGYGVILRNETTPWTGGGTGPPEPTPPPPDDAYKNVTFADPPFPGCAVAFAPTIGPGESGAVPQ